MLSFQVTNGGTVQIFCDDEGMATLTGALDKIRPTGGHVHLCAPSCGGKELSDQTPWGDDAVAEVIVTWTGE